MISPAIPVPALYTNRAKTLVRNNSNLRNLRIQSYDIWMVQEKPTYIGFTREYCIQEIQLLTHSSKFYSQKKTAHLRPQWSCASKISRIRSVASAAHVMRLSSPLVWIGFSTSFRLLTGLESFSNHCHYRCFGRPLGSFPPTSVFTLILSNLLWSTLMLLTLPQLFDPPSSKLTYTR